MECLRMIFVILLLYFNFSVLHSQALNCSSYDNVTDTCTIINQSESTSDSQSLNFTNIIIKDSYLFCEYSGFYKCAFKINASSLIIQNSTVYYMIIELNGTNFTINNSNLSTNGTIKNGIGRTNHCSEYLNDVGLGYAGSGAFCQDLYPQCGRSYGSLDLLLNETDDPDNCLGTGSGQFIIDFYGCGGGRVFVNFTQIFLMGGNIFSASGSPQKEPQYDCTKRGNFKNNSILNGGTGGYIYVESQYLTWNKTSDFLKIIAEGGNYCDTYDKKSTKFAGSGGRIIMNVDPSLLTNVKYYMKGGVNDISVSQQNVNPCRNGASGSLYFRRNKTVVFNNDGYAANSITQIPSNISFSKISILNGSRGGPEDNNTLGTINSKSIYVSQAFLVYERFFNNLTIQNCDLLSVDSANDTGGIGPPEQNSKNSSLYINAKKVNFNINTIIQFGKEFNLQCDLVNFNGTVQSYFYDSGLYVSCININFYGAMIEVSMIGIYTINNLIIKSSKLKAFKQKCKNGSVNYNPYVNFLDYNLAFKGFSTASNLEILHFLIQNNYTFFILTPGNLTFSLENSTDPTKNIVQGANIGFFASNINITQGFIVSSEDLGCNNEQGPGNGTQDDNLGNKCGGTGGSYGGFGSLAWSNYSDILKDCLKIKSPSIYGDIENPIYEGSGGGGNQEHLNPGGKGGGVIILGALKNLTIDGIVSSSGSSPETQMGKATAGSGSGGSIQIFMKYLLGKGSVKSEGGSTQSWGIGGPGGGGRIRVNFLTWYDGDYYSANWTGTFSVKQGNRSDFINLPEDSNENMGKGSNKKKYFNIHIFSCEHNTLHAWTLWRSLRLLWI